MGKESISVTLYHLCCRMQAAPRQNKLILPTGGITNPKQLADIGLLVQHKFSVSSLLKTLPGGVKNWSALDNLQQISVGFQPCPTFKTSKGTVFLHCTRAATLGKRKRFQL